MACIGKPNFYRPVLASIQSSNIPKLFSSFTIIRGSFTIRGFRGLLSFLGISPFGSCQAIIHIFMKAAKDALQHVLLQQDINILALERLWCQDTELCAFKEHLQCCRKRQHLLLFLLSRGSRLGIRLITTIKHTSYFSWSDSLRRASWTSPLSTCNLGLPAKLAFLQLVNCSVLSPHRGLQIAGWLHCNFKNNCLEVAPQDLQHMTLQSSQKSLWT